MLRTYAVQLHRWDLVPVDLTKVDRLDINALLDTLHFPVIWSYDQYLHAWMPGEIDHEMLRWLESKPSSIENRASLLRRAGVLGPEGQVSWDELTKRRVKDGVVKIPSLLAPEYAKWLASHYHRSPHTQRWPDMPGISRTSINDHAIIRLLHSQIKPFIEHLIGEPLKPSYSFTAAYDATSNLPAHTDRPQCTYNVSLLFDGEPSTVPLEGWPLNVKVGAKTHSVGLNAGDGVLYSGTRDLHWREKMPGTLSQVTGTFMHYVPASFTGTLT
jgi:hypothetical protein